MNEYPGPLFSEWLHRGEAKDVNQCTVPGWWVTGNMTSREGMPYGELYGVVEFIPRLIGGSATPYTTERSTERVYPFYGFRIEFIRSLVRSTDAEGIVTGGKEVSA